MKGPNVMVAKSADLGKIKPADCGMKTMDFESCRFRKTVDFEKP